MFDLLKGLFLLAALPTVLAAQPMAPLPLMADDPVAERLDDLAALPWVRNSPLSADTVKLNVNGFPASYIPAWPEATYQSRLQVLDGNTPFNLEIGRASCRERVFSSV